jgi:tetratricopeptide (TPR) repeat protein
MREEKTEKARQQYERILGEHPSKQMYVSYGTLLMKTQDYQGAVSAYEKALALDPGFPSALYDIAAAYKNWAKANQDAKKPDWKQQLDKSTDYFERLHALDKNDANVLVQLAENYDVSNKRDKAIALVGDMEALKTTDAGNTHEYWEMLGRLYARANRGADSQAAYKKADELKQQGK